MILAWNSVIFDIPADSECRHRAEASVPLITVPALVGWNRRRGEVFRVRCFADQFVGPGGGCTVCRTLARLWARDLGDELGSLGATDRAWIQAATPPLLEHLWAQIHGPLSDLQRRIACVHDRDIIRFGKWWKPDPGPSH